MNNLSPFPAKVNGSAAKPTIADVVSWVEAQAEKADMGAASARIRSTSLVQMAEQIAEDEPGDAAWVFENMERMRDHRPGPCVLSSIPVFVPGIDARHR
jgi:hypothetical protein